ncbi:tetratricopeptide repeat-containing sensor histidine kinase [Lacinutrix sp. MEBiC02595]
MKRIFPLFIILFVFQYSFSQQKVMDSLEQVLSKMEGDSLKYQESVKLVNFYSGRDSDVHLNLLRKFYNQSLEDKDEIRQGKWINEKVLYYIVQGNLDSAMVLSERALKMGKRLENQELIRSSKSSLGAVYRTMGESLKAIELYNQMLKDDEVRGKEEEKEHLTTIYRLSGAYYNIAEYNKSFDLVASLYNKPKVKKDPEFLSKVYLQMAMNKYQLDENNAALQYAKEAESIAEKTSLKSNIYNVFSALYTDAEDYKKANEYQLKALAISEELGDQVRIIINKQNIANNSVFIEDYDLGEQQLKEVETILSTMKYPNWHNIAVNYEMLSYLYEKKTDYKKALVYAKKRADVHDSVLGIEKKKAISEIEIKYDTEKVKREKEVAEKQVVITKLESQRNRNLFIGALAVAGLLLLASVFYFSRLKAKKKAELVTIELKETQKRLAIEKQYRDSELKALKAQMNPHFIFNALNSIQDYIVLNKKNLASDYLGKFADLIRNYLHFSDTGFISILDEVHNLNLYLELEKLRFEEKLEYTFQVDEAANSEDIHIPTMLIQPYVENALKHGLLHKKDNRKLKISIGKPSDKTIECSIEDNGIGREKSKEITSKRESHHKSFALKATTERLDLLNYGREKKIGVAIIDLHENNCATGTKVILRIPILKQ